MQPQWVRPARRPCGEHTGERDLGVATPVHFEHVAIRTMKPGDDDDLVARSDPEESSREGRIHIEPRVWRSLEASIPRALLWFADFVFVIFSQMPFQLAEAFPPTLGIAIAHRGRIEPRLLDNHLRLRTLLDERNSPYSS
jgi:hypothetical protein